MTTIQPQYRIEQEHGILITYEHIFFVPLGDRQEVLIQRLSQYEYQVRQNMEIFLDKNNTYGDAFIKGGVAGCMFELWGGMMRLFVLSLKAPSFGKYNRTKVLVTLRDMANYTIMTLILIYLNKWEANL